MSDTTPIDTPQEVFRVPNPDAVDGRIENNTIPRIGAIQNKIISDNRFFYLCDELYSGRAGTPTEMSGDREYVRRFLVGVKFKEMSSFHVCQCPGIPKLGGFYIHPAGIDYDTLAVAVKFSARPAVEDDWQLWIVEVIYSTKVTEGGAVGDYAQDDPTEEPIVYKFGNEVQQEAPETDLDGAPFFNSAGSPFTPAHTFELAYPTLTVTRNESQWSLQRSQEFSYALNNKLFLGYPPGLVQCLPPTAEPKYRGILRYYRVTYVLRFRRLELEDDPNFDKGEVGIVNPPVELTTGPSAADLFPSVDPDNIIKNLTDLRDSGKGGDALGGVINNIIGKLESPAKVEPGITMPELTGTINNNPIAMSGKRFITWQPRILDAGLDERRENLDYDPDVTSDDPQYPWRNKPTKLFPIFNSAGRPVGSPQCLDGMGKQQTKVDSFGRPVPVYLHFRYYQEMDLSIIFNQSFSDTGHNL